MGYLNAKVSSVNIMIGYLWFCAATVALPLTAYCPSTESDTRPFGFLLTGNGHLHQIDYITISGRLKSCLLHVGNKRSVDISPTRDHYLMDPYRRSRRPAITEDQHGLLSGATYLADWTPDILNITRRTLTSNGPPLKVLHLAARPGSVEFKAPIPALSVGIEWYA